MGFYVTGQHKIIIGKSNKNKQMQIIKAKSGVQ